MYIKEAAFADNSLCVRKINTSLARCVMAARFAALAASSFCSDLFCASSPAFLELFLFCKMIRQHSPTTPFGLFFFCASNKKNLKMLEFYSTFTISNA